jgi:hypothetical protein
MELEKVKGVLPSEKYLLAAAAFILPLYDFILATLLGRQLSFEIAPPVVIFLSLIASTGFFIFLKESLDSDLKVSAAAAILTALVLPKIIVEKPVGFGERVFIYMLPSAFGVLAAFFESGLRRKWSALEIENLKTNRSVQIGVLHVALALEMYIIARDMKFGEFFSRNLNQLKELSLATFFSPVLMLPLNFFIAAVPVYLYQKKKLKAPLAVFLTWVTAGTVQFFLRWDIYPVRVFYGGAQLLPPQPDYLLRPWLPLTLVIVAWKLEEKYRERKSGDKG